MECPKCNGLNSLDARFCTSCGASIKEPPEKESLEQGEPPVEDPTPDDGEEPVEEPIEEEPFDFSTWGGRVKFAGGLVVLAAILIGIIGIFEDAISSWGWIWGIVGGIIIILLLILFRSAP